MPLNPIRVLIVDDSAVTRDRIAAALEADRELTVVSTAMNTAIAKHKIQRDLPDVLLLDINLPGASGLSLLRSMPIPGLPTVVFSGHAPSGSDAALEAIDAGAVAVIEKPTGANVGDTMAELRLALKGAAKLAKHRRQPSAAPVGSTADGSVAVSGDSPSPAGANGYALAGPASAGLSRARGVGAGVSHPIIAIGASTGGTDAIRDVLMGLPPNCPPIVAVIHMPDLFTGGFAKRLDKICPIRVEEARDGQQLEPGLCLIAPGDRHLALRGRRDGSSHVALFDAPRVMRHRPSVDVLFESVAATAGAQAMGILLTGMGADGAKGMLSMRKQGAFTVAQSERTCVVYGMPARAVDLGAADVVADLEDIAGACLKWMRRI